MALRTLVPITTNFGVEIPAGCIILYRHNTNISGNEFKTEFDFYANQAALNSGQSPIHPSLINKLLTAEGKFYAFAITEVKHDTSAPSVFESWDDLFDGMAIAALLKISTFGLEEIECIGRVVIPQPNQLEPEVETNKAEEFDGDQTSAPVTE